mmetsp:Transcript_45096/g.94563  ORF Transcript_45096/g.94563 Transcript_45096/m.94563 type:complete len:277 (-) Transcript_45096:256-1086(-)
MFIIVSVDNLRSILFKEESYHLGRGLAMGVDHGKVKGIAALVFAFGNTFRIVLKKDLQDLSGGSVGACVVHWQHPSLILQLRRPRISQQPDNLRHRVPHIIIIPIPSPTRIQPCRTRAPPQASILPRCRHCPMILMRVLSKERKMQRCAKPLILLHLPLRIRRNQRAQYPPGRSVRTRVMKGKPSIRIRPSHRLLRAFDQTIHNIHRRIVQFAHHVQRRGQELSLVHRRLLSIALTRVRAQPFSHGVPSRAQHFSHARGFRRAEFRRGGIVGGHVH